MKRRLEKAVIVFCGPPCSGKTALAASIQSETGFPHLAVDRLVTELIPDARFDLKDRDIAYRAIVIMAGHLLQSKCGVIADATYARRPHLDQLQAEAERCQAAFFLIECRAAADLAVERFRLRDGRHPATDLDEERVRTLADIYPYRSTGIVVETSRPMAACLDEIRRYISL